MAAPKAHRAHAVEGTLISHSWAHSCRLKAVQGRVVPGVKKKAHFSREVERKWLLLPGPSRRRVYGTLLLSVLPHGGEGGSAPGDWGYRLLAAEPGSRS